MVLIGNDSLRVVPQFCALLHQLASRKLLYRSGLIAG